jgi:hypothetical protein
MASAYPGELERQKCASRTREELIEYRPARPPSVEDRLQMSWMLARCSFCAACPMIVRALEIMSLAPKPEAADNIIRLAG